MIEVITTNESESNSAQSLMTEIFNLTITNDQKDFLDTLNMKVGESLMG
jgi:hypothetical protein